MAKSYQQHELGKCYPVMSESELDELADDIGKNGQNFPVLLFNEEIIDGWNRYLACEMAGVDPWVVDETSALKGRDLFAYVLSNNGVRRHMSVKDRSIAAVKLSKTKALKEKAAENQKKSLKRGNSPSLPKGSDGESKRAVAVAAKAVGASPTSTARAATVLKSGAAATKKAMEKDEISLNKAAEISKLPKSDQAAAVKEAKKPAKQKRPDRTILLTKVRSDFGRVVRGLDGLGLGKRLGIHIDAIAKEIKVHE